MFLRNFWYVAAADDEIGRQPLGRTILGEPVVLFRTEDWTPGCIRRPVSASPPAALDGKARR